MGLQPLRLVIEGIDKVTRPIRQVNRSIEGMVAPIRRVRRNFQALGREAGLAKIGRAMRNVGTAGARLGRATVGLVRNFALLGGAVGGGALLALQRVAAEGDRIAKTAGRIGIGTERLQELRFGAERSGTSVELLDKSLEGMVRRVGEAKVGTGTLTTLLKKSNPALLAQLKTVEKSEDAFDLIAEAIANETDQTKRAALANAAFGRQGLQLLNFLQLGKAGIDDFAARARELGLVMSDRMTKDSADFVDSMTDLKAAATGLRNVIGGELIPQLTPWIVKLANLTAANKGLVRSRVAEFVEKLPGRFARVSESVSKAWEAIRPFVRIAQRIVEVLGPANTVFALLATKVVITVVPALLSMAGALSALGVTFSLTPIGLFLAALAAVAGGAFLVIKNWDKIKGFFKGLWDGEKARAQVWIDFVKDAFSGLVAWIGRQMDRLGGLIPGPLRDAFGISDGGPGAAAASPSRPGPIARPIPGLAAVANSTPANLSGRLKIELVTPDGLEARVSEADSSLLDFDVDTGRTMLGSG